MHASEESHSSESNLSSSTSGPLSGLLVLDLTRVLAGPYCTMMLAEMGARVIKIEHPQGGDDSRSFGPFVADISSYFMSLNRGKESIALNLKSESDRAVFETLLSHADVLVENFRPGTMEKLGYGWSELHAQHPRLIYASISGFGQTGPYARRPAYDLIVQGMGGLMSITGQPNSAPTRVGTSVGDITSALFACNGIVSALYHRERHQCGTHVDISMLDCQVAILENAIARYTSTQQIPQPLGARHPSITPFDAFETRDGYITLAAGNDALFKALCNVLQCPELALDPSYSSNAQRTQNAQALKRVLETILRTHDSAYWLQHLENAGIPSGPIHDISAVLDDPQIHARNMLVTAEDPIAGVIQMAGNPIKNSAFEDPSKRTPAPQLDQHRTKITEEYLCD